MMLFRRFLPVIRTFKREELSLKTSGRRDVIDITDDIDRLIKTKGLVNGVIHVRALHTTAGVLEQENEPMFHEDLFDRLDQIAPPDGDYKHDKIGTLRTVNVCDDECANGWAHIQRSFIPNYVLVQVYDGLRIQGRWDRVLLLEFDSARPRKISLLFDGEFIEPK